MNGKVSVNYQILFIILDGNKRWEEDGNYAIAKHATN